MLWKNSPESRLKFVHAPAPYLALTSAWTWLAIFERDAAVGYPSLHQLRGERLSAGL